MLNKKVKLFRHKKRKYIMRKSINLKVIGNPSWTGHLLFCFKLIL